MCVPAGDVAAPGQQGLLLKVVPEKDFHSLEVQWVAPPEIAAYRAQPCGYLSHLLGCGTCGISGLTVCLKQPGVWQAMRSRSCLELQLQGWSPCCSCKGCLRGQTDTVQCIHALPSVCVCECFCELPEQKGPRGPVDVSVLICQPTSIQAAAPGRRRSTQMHTSVPLFRHEGEGSVCALLKRKGWAVELSAGESGLSFSSASVFSISIVLTDEGGSTPESFALLTAVGLKETPQTPTCRFEA